MRYRSEQHNKMDRESMKTQFSREVEGKREEEEEEITR